MRRSRRHRSRRRQDDAATIAMPVFIGNVRPQERPGRNLRCLFNDRRHPAHPQGRRYFRGAGAVPCRDLRPASAPGSTARGSSRPLAPKKNPPRREPGGVETGRCPREQSDYQHRRCCHPSSGVCRDVSSPSEMARRLAPVRRRHIRGPRRLSFQPSFGTRPNAAAGAMNGGGNAPRRITGAEADDRMILREVDDPARRDSGRASSRPRRVVPIRSPIPHISFVRSSPHLPRIYSTTACPA